MLNQLGLQGLASIGVVGTNISGQQAMQSSGMLNGYNSQQAQSQLAQQYNWAQQRIVVEPPQWAFNGVVYKTAREMADAIWTHDCPDKTHFLLKYE